MGAHCEVPIECKGLPQVILLGVCATPGSGLLEIQSHLDAGKGGWTVVEWVMARMGRRQVGLLFILILTMYFRNLGKVSEWTQFLLS